MMYICLWEDNDGDLHATWTDTNGRPRLPSGAALLCLIEYAEGERPTLYVASSGGDELDELGVENNFGE